MSKNIAENTAEKNTAEKNTANAAAANANATNADKADKNAAKQPESIISVFNFKEKEDSQHRIRRQILPQKTKLLQTAKLLRAKAFISLREKFTAARLSRSLLSQHTKQSKTTGFPIRFTDIS